MTCILYREGKGAVEHGIECESTTCEVNQLEELINAGWLLNPPGYVAPEPVEPETAEPEDKEGDEESSLQKEIDSLTDQVRILTELDEKSQEEILRLNGELEFAAEAEASLKAEIERLVAAAAESPEESSSLNPVRLKAKEAGIEGWDTKRIKTLEAMLEA